MSIDQDLWGQFAEVRELGKDGVLAALTRAWAERVLTNI